MSLLNEASSTEERMYRAVVLLQRHSAAAWTEHDDASATPADSEQKYSQKQAHVDDDSGVCGIGALLSVNAQGMLVVSRVQRPGPADGKLWGGDILYELNGETLTGLLPGVALHKVLGFSAAGQTDGNVQIGVVRSEERVYETLHRRLPPMRERLAPDVITVMREAQGRISVTDLHKMLRMLGAVPNILCDEELTVVLGHVSLSNTRAYACIHVHMPFRRC
jgi:hypothetical protein